MSVEIENLHKRIQLLTAENNRLYSKLKTQQRKNTRLRSVLRKNGVRYAEDCDKNITTRELIVENENENDTGTISNVVQEVIVDSNEHSEACSSEGDGNISDNWEDTSMELSRN